MNINIRENKGFTLVEILMGLLIFTVAFLTISTVFTSISKSILVNKTKTIGTNLAQEKIESLKNMSYFKLLISTAVNTDSNFTGMKYDIGTTQSYYPEETLYVGGFSFKRRVLVEYLKQDGNDLVPQPWTSNDTGIKRISVYVVWKEGDEWKKVELRNLRNNPNRAELEYTISGTVSSGTAPAIYNALVETEENPSYYGRTDASGNYSFKVQPGTYTLRASATGYFTSLGTSCVVVNSGDTGSATRDFHLTKMEYGSATGYAFIRDHLVISQVCPSTDVSGKLEQEWVELYNPTTYDMLIASRSVSGGDFDLFFVTVTWIDNGNDEPEHDPGVNDTLSKYLLGRKDATACDFIGFRSTSSHWSVNTPTISIPSQSFFLISNYSTITYRVSGSSVNRIADAYYFHPTQTGGSEIDTHDIGGEGGGIRVTGAGGYSYNSKSDWIDGIAWKKDSGSDSDKAKEGSILDPGIGGSGDTKGYVFLRTGFKGSYSDNQTNNTVNWRNYSPFFGNCFDRNSNGSDITAGGDWITITANNFLLTSSAILNSDASSPPLSGTPAVGSGVSIDDGHSSINYVESFGSYTVTNIATGTWTLLISSGNYYTEITTMTVRVNITTAVPNNSTVPQWIVSGFPSVALTSSTSYGYISGIVKDAFGNGLSGVTVTGGGDTKTTSSSGKFRLSVTPTSNITVTASKNQYSTEIIQDIGVSLGMTVSTLSFSLISAGYVTGFLTGNGYISGKLPGVPVVAYSLDSTTILGSAITDTNGNFLIPSITTGTYRIAPQLESGETCSPEYRELFVTVQSTGTYASTFTITNAFGNISGTVGIGSVNNPITTGVLIVAATQTITTERPPDMTSALRSDGQIYYAASSNASGTFELPVRGNASYYIYGWYPTSLDVSSSSAPKRQLLKTSAVCPNCHYVGPGETVIKDITW